MTMILLGLGVLVLLALPAVPLPITFSALVILRTFTDVGASTTGSLLPSSTVSAAIGVAMIVLALLPARGAPPLPRTVRRIALAYLVLMLIGSVVGLITFGPDSVLLQEALRLASLLGALICAVRVVLAGGPIARHWPIIVILPSALALLGLYLSRSQVGTDQGRAAGTFSHPNSAAAFFAAGTIVLAGRYLTRRSRGVLVALVLCGAALLGTQSLGSILGAVAGVFALVLFRPGVRLAPRILGAVVILGAAVGVAVSSGAGGRLQEFSEYNANSALATGTSTNSLEWRLINWARLLKVWSQSPIWGFGTGSTGARIQPLHAPPHSMPVQMLVEFGLLGTAIIVGLLILAVRRVLAVGRGTPEAALMVGLVVFVIVTGSESNLMDYTAVDYLLAFAAASIVALDRTAAGPAESDHRQERAIARARREAIRAQAS